jgi:flagellar basal body-associated protein FliL
MKTILIIVLVLALVAGAVYVGTKFFGLAKDEDKDGIPDKIEDTAKEVKRRAKRVKEELGDIADAAKDVVEQVGDIKEAVKGKPRKGRKPRAKKASK